MDNTMDWDARDRKEQPQPVDCYPIGWISTEELEDELFNAVMMDFSTRIDEEAFEEVDDYLDGDEEFESEAEQRRSTLTLLATLRPRLAELLGGPPAESSGN
ncbi:MAG: hypothetical protein ABSF70_12980 [Terracidiphilus sp.]|jgi:hypothetical protein